LVQVSITQGLKPAALTLPARHLEPKCLPLVLGFVPEVSGLIEVQVERLCRTNQSCGAWHLAGHSISGGRSKIRAPSHQTDPSSSNDRDNSHREAASDQAAVYIAATSATTGLEALRRQMVRPA
jgi:hypothetical protein